MNRFSTFDWIWCLTLVLSPALQTGKIDVSADPVQKLREIVSVLRLVWGPDLDSNYRKYTLGSSSFVYLACPSPAGTAQTMVPESRLKFDLYDDYAVVLHGSIRGLPTNVLVDTGSIDTILDSAVAKRLRLKTYEEVKLVLLNQIRTAKRAVVDYDVGTSSVTQSVLVTDLRGFSAELGVTIGLILGYSGLCRYGSLEIDYQARELVLGSGTGDCGNALPIVSSEVPGRTDPVRLLVDTGNKGLLLFGSSSNYGFVPGTTKTGTDPRKLRSLFGTIAALRFGNTLLTNQEAYLIERPDLVPSLIDGFLGAGGLGLRALRIDFKAHTADLTFR
jgi:hypothetical protein